MGDAGVCGRRTRLLSGLHHILEKFGAHTPPHHPFDIHIYTYIYVFSLSFFSCLFLV